MSCLKGTELKHQADEPEKEQYSFVSLTCCSGLTKQNWLLRLMTSLMKMALLVLMSLSMVPSSWSRQPICFAEDFHGRGSLFSCMLGSCSLFLQWKARQTVFDFNGSTWVENRRSLAAACSEQMLTICCRLPTDVASNIRSSQYARAPYMARRTRILEVRV